VQLVNYPVDRRRADGTVVLGRKESDALFDLIGFRPSPRKLEKGRSREKLTDREVELCRWLARRFEDWVSRSARMRSKRKSAVRIVFDPHPPAPPRVSVDWDVVDVEIRTFEEFVAFVERVVTDRQLDIGRELCRCRRCAKFFWKTPGTSEWITRTLCGKRCYNAAGVARTEKSRSKPKA
jgi:hypothetical protein